LGELRSANRFFSVIVKKVAAFEKVMA